MQTTQFQISGDKINQIIRHLSKIKNLDASKNYKLENVARINGMASVVYAYTASLLIKNKGQIAWMQQLIQFCQVYFQKAILDEGEK